MVLDLAKVVLYKGTTAAAEQCSNQGTVPMTIYPNAEFPHLFEMSTKDGFHIRVDNDPAEELVSLRIENERYGLIQFLVYLRQPDLAALHAMLGRAIDKVKNDSRENV